jgi:hypothetical protein
MIWATQIGRELTLNKLIYLKGKHCKLRTIGEQMEELRFLLENHIHNLHHSSFIQLKLPVISNTSSVLSFAGNLNYLVYNVVSMANNYNIHINNFLAVFWVVCVDSMNDCYSLFCKDKKGNISHYQNALINSSQSSRFMKKTLRIKHQNYENIEMSDGEDGETGKNGEDDQGELGSGGLSGVYMYCLFDKEHKRWKPYKLCKANNLLSDISKVKNLEEKSSRI